MRRILFTISWTAVLLATVHCNKQKKKAAKAPDYNSTYTVGSYDSTGTAGGSQVTADAVAGFIRAVELKNPGNLKPTNSADIVSAVSNNSYFYRNGSSKSAAGGCLANTLAAHQYSVSGDQYVARFFEPNLVACFQSDPAFAGLSITNATLNFLHVVICPEADLKKFNNISVLAAQSIAKPSECVSEVYNLNVVISATTTKNGSRAIVTRTVNVAKIGGNQVPLPAAAATSSNQGAALALEGETTTGTPTPKGDGAVGCVQSYDGETSTSDGCQFISSTVDNWVPAVYPDNQYTLIADQALTAKSPGQGPYYASGAMIFSINGWIGEMTYTAPYDQPSWNARYGAGNVASGVFGIAVPKPTSPQPSTAQLTNMIATGSLNYTAAATAAINKPFVGQN